MQTTLVNFNLPVELKERFDQVCRMSGRTRTSILIELVTGYVIDQSEVLEERRSRLYLAGRQLNTIEHFREQESKADSDTGDRSIGVQSPSESEIDGYDFGDDDEEEVTIAVDAILRREW